MSRTAVLTVTLVIGLLEGFGGRFKQRWIWLSRLVLEDFLKAKST